ncbi:MAG: hypothetical protein N7Q72_06410, partial [Spiroplasma sp. Tabriz.8]|nr:hypothetical protein [Spiroplasma sp. Tabriz.8]
KYGFITQEQGDWFVEWTQIETETVKVLRYKSIILNTYYIYIYIYIYIYKVLSWYKLVFIRFEKGAQTK